MTASASAIETPPGLLEHRGRQAAPCASAARSHSSEMPQAPLRQQSEDPVYRRRPQPDQMHPPPQLLAQRALLRAAAARAPAPSHVGRARRAPWRRPCRSCRPAARRLEPCAHTRPAPSSRPRTADRGPRPRRSSSPRTPTPPCRASRRAASPSSSAGTAPSPVIAPPSLKAHHDARRYAQSSPTYCIAGPPSRVDLQPNTQSAGRPPSRHSMQGGSSVRPTSRCPLCT